VPLLTLENVILLPGKTTHLQLKRLIGSGSVCGSHLCALSPKCLKLSKFNTAYSRKRLVLSSVMDKVQWNTCRRLIART